MYQSAIEGAYKEYAELVAICDTNPGRLKYSQSKSQAAGAAIPRAYAAADFEKMLAEIRPDHVIVTTVDCFHHEYIVKTMEAGVHPITGEARENTPGGGPPTV